MAVGFPSSYTYLLENAIREYILPLQLVEKLQTNIISSGNCLLVKLRNGKGKSHIICKPLLIIMLKLQNTSNTEHLLYTLSSNLTGIY